MTLEVKGITQPEEDLMGLCEGLHGMLRPVPKGRAV